MSKKARTAAPKAAPAPSHTFVPTTAPTTARPPEASPASKPASRPIRKSRIDVDQAMNGTPTQRLKPAAKASRPSTPAAARNAKAASTLRGTRRSSGRLSALDAAAQVLAGLSKAESREGITAPDLIERMAKAKLWSSPGGKTPAATLYAAMIREITKKGAASRFKRIAPGRFAASSASRVKPATLAKPAKSRAEVTA